MAGSLRLTREQLAIITRGDPRAIKALEDFFATLTNLGSHHATHEPGGSDPMTVDAAVAVGSLRTLGTGAAQAAVGNHNHKLDDLSAPDDNTDLNASAAVHGLLPKLSGVATDALLGDGTWAPPAALLPMDARPGMTLSYSSGTVFGVSKGTRLADDASGVILATGAWTKTVNAAWAAGTGNGAMDTGSAPASGTLHIYAIGKDDGSLDYLCSDPAVTTPGSPVMPPGWTRKRYIWSLRTSGSDILAFDQNGDRCILRALVNDRPYAAIPNTSRNLQALTVPPNTVAIVEITTYGVAFAYYWIRPTAFTDAAASATNCTGAVNTGNFGGSEMLVEADSSSQIAYRGNTTNLNLQIETAGWIDRRMAFTGME